MRWSITMAVTVATVGLATGYGWAMLWPGLGLVIAGGAVWLIAQAWPAWRSDTPMLIVFGGLAGAGIVWGAPPLLMVVGLVGALSAWDLARFEQRLSQANRIDDEAGLRRAHWRRLGLVGASGLLLAGLALGLQVRLTLFGAILLGLLIVIGLGRVVGGLFRGTPSQ